MKCLYPHRRPMACLLLFIFLLFQVSCSYYQRYPMAKTRLPKINTENLSFYLVDAGHPLTKVWYVSEYSIGAKTMTGFLTKLSVDEANQVVTVRGNYDAKTSKNEVLLFAKPTFAYALADTANVVLSFDQIEKIEVYEMNFGKTVSYAFLGYLAIGFLISILALALKGSCPFVYADNPDGMQFQGELYSGATYPQLERHDWLPLPDLKPKDNTYRLRLANKAKEIQHTNLLELVVVDHPAGTSVLYDKYGGIQTIQTPSAPLEAIDFEGNDCRKAILDCDTLIWHGNENNQRPRAEEGMILHFEKPAGAQTAKLLLNAKNTFWLDYMYGLFLDEFGSYSDYVRGKYLQKSEAEIRQWMNEQNLPLTVSLETSPGHWEKVDYFNIAGPMSLKKDVLSLDVSKIAGTQVRIKLETGFLFWEIDQVAIDYSENLPVTINTLKPVSAIDQHSVDVSAALSGDDKLYYSQPNVGDEAMIQYPVPAQAGSTERSLLLHAKGHYQILRDPAPGHPSLLYLRSFQKPDALPNYSRERWWDLAKLDVVVQGD